jgi:hypothetical protein
VRRRRVHWIAVAALLTGCGYPGEPLPPALKRPIRVADLTGVERGSKIYVQFTVPSVTTEGMPVKGRPDIELRMGPLPEGGFEKWQQTSARVRDSEIHVENATATAQIDVSKLYGKTVVVAVRVHGPHGQDVGWSRPETVELVLALPVPEGLTAVDAPDAVKLEWHAAAPEYRIFRKMPDEAAFRQIGTSDKPSYSDTTIEYGKSYEYLVQSVETSGERYAESEPSTGIAFKPIDKFPPAVPAGLTAIPASRNIELVWDRDTDRDLASYQVYRDGMKIAEGLTAPAYSDKDVKPGTRYRYQVLAVDTAGNASALCPAVETAIP